MNCVAAAIVRLGVGKGLWQYLIIRSELRAALEKERERNRAFAAYLEGLPHNAELMDYEDGEGRKFWIRKYGPGASGADRPVPPAVVVELGSASAVQVLPIEGPKRAG